MRGFRFDDPSACTECGGKGIVWERVKAGFSEKKCPVCLGTGNKPLRNIKARG